MTYAHSLDMLITSNALGWKLDKELNEVERVVRPGGHNIHLLQSNVQVENPIREILVNPPWTYTCLVDNENLKFRYFIINK